MMTRRLLRLRRALYASRAYIKQFGTPAAFEDLAQHRIAAHSIVDVGGIRWNYNGVPLSEPKALPNPRWLINDSAALERFVLSGAGLALVSTFEGEGWCEQGELVRVLPNYEQEGASASLVWPSSRYLAPRVRAFIDHAVGTMGDGS